MIDIGTITLTSGDHISRDDGVCAMEAVAWIAGEPHSDAPKCAAPTLRRLLIGLNDARWASDAERTMALAPFLPRIIGTAPESADVARRRAFVLADIAVREIAVEALRLRGRTEAADRLAALDPITDKATAEKARAAAYAYAADAYAYAAADDAAAYAAADAADYAAEAADDARGSFLARFSSRLIEAALAVR